MIEVHGAWDKGVVIDRHTISSEFIGNNEHGRAMFDTKRTEIGELVYKLKYQSDAKVLSRIIEIVKASITGIEAFDVIVPIPPSKTTRSQQPVDLIANAIGIAYGVPVINALSKNSLEEIKSIVDKTERINKLKQSVTLNGGFDFSNMSILIVDDLFDSGSTLSVATELLKELGHARRICILAMTKTKNG